MEGRWRLKPGQTISVCHVIVFWSLVALIRSKCRSTKQAGWWKSLFPISQSGIRKTPFRTPATTHAHVCWTDSFISWVSITLHSWNPWWRPSVVLAEVSYIFTTRYCLSYVRVFTIIKSMSNNGYRWSHLQRRKATQSCQSDVLVLPVRSW